MGTASQSSRVRELVDRIRTAYHFRKYHNAWAAGRFCQMNVGYNLRVPEEVPVTDEKGCAVRYSLSMRSNVSPFAADWSDVGKPTSGGSSSLRSPS
jgi:hypothetical protein